MNYAGLFTNNELNLNIYTFLVSRGRFYNIKNEYSTEYSQKYCILHSYTAYYTK